MNISINIHKVAQELTDADKLHKGLSMTKLYVNNMRASADYQRRYEHYIKILKANKNDN